MTTLYEPNLPGDFAQTVIDAVPGMLKRQSEDGSIDSGPKPIVYAQQAIMPLAFAWAGLDGKGTYKESKEVGQAIENLAGFLCRQFNEKGEFHYNSNGYEVNGVDQRLTYAWVEALRMLREAGGDFDFAAWEEKIVAACHTLIGHRLERLKGLRRLVGWQLGTSTNHVGLYLTTLYRAGTAFNKQELLDIALPIARTLAQDIHPDGYFDEHSDLSRQVGPTPSYNYLTHCAMALLYEWTGEAVFREATLRGTEFFARFSYPDGTVFDLIDERVRYQKTATTRVWGMFGFSHTPEGRGMATQMFGAWRGAQSTLDETSPELLARLVENFTYWHEGPADPPRYTKYRHAAALSLPAAIHKKGDWCVGLSAMRATNDEDPVFRDNPFALERQKLFSVWHKKVGLIADGSHSKQQRENSTFSVDAYRGLDHLPCGGAVFVDGEDLVARATYRTFYGEARLRILDEHLLQVDLSVDPAAVQGPFEAGFTILPSAELLAGMNGKTAVLGSSDLSLSGEALGGGFQLGMVTVKGPADMQVSWPMRPFNSYAKDHKAKSGAGVLRVHAPLTWENRRASFIIAVAK